jgi:glycosyltransferase involved in cell wall biosynthesis
MTRFAEQPGMMATPAITAVIPLHNGAPFIVEALESVFAQTLPPAAIIVVDDGSTDDGPDIVGCLATHHPLTLLRKSNGGQSSARNLGIAHARTPLVALLDQDDTWCPEHLERLSAPFRDTNPRAPGWVHGNVATIDRSGAILEPRHLDRFRTTEHPKRTLAGCLANDMFVLPSACLIDKAAFLSVGGFDEDLIGYEDDDLFLRLFLAGFENVYVEETVSHWRVHAGSASTSPTMLSSRLRYFRKLLRTVPDRDGEGRSLVEQLVAWRFFKATVLDHQRACGHSDLAGREQALAVLRELLPHLDRRAGLRGRMMMPFAHLMRVPTIGPAAARVAPAVWAACKRFAT